MFGEAPCVDCTVVLIYGSKKRSHDYYPRCIELLECSPMAVNASNGRPVRVTRTRPIVSLGIKVFGNCLVVSENHTMTTDWTEPSAVAEYSTVIQHTAAE